MPPIQFVVEGRESGKTLAAVLKRRYSLSWSQAKRLVEGRHIRVAGHIETDVARRLKFGKPVSIDAGAVEIRKPPGARPKDKEVGRPGDKETKKPPRAMAKAGAVRKAQPLPIGQEALVYVDEAVVVVNKPAGLTTMRHEEEAAEFGEHGRRFLTKTLAGMLPALLGSPTRPVTAVHRLDRDTSGLVVFARTPAAGEHLAAQFRKHTVDRRYLALTRGVPKPGRVESVLVPDRGDGRRGSSRRPTAAGGKKAVTRVKVVEELGAFALVECRLETGRTHQVRIHLGEAGTPLCGEQVYDREVNRKPPPDTSGAALPMLHAGRLGFRHPETGDEMAWEAPPPADFQGLLAALRK